MTLTLLGNYAQTGHFGGPLAYTPFNVATHLVGPEMGGLRYDYRRPKHPYADKFMLAAGHCAPTCYALWMIMGEALYRKYRATGDRLIHHCCLSIVVFLHILVTVPINSGTAEGPAIDDLHESNAAFQ